MAAPTKAQFEACRKPPLRRAKNVGKNHTFSDLNDQKPWREYNFLWKTSFLQTPLQTNDEYLEKVSETTGGVNMFFFLRPL